MTQITQHLASPGQPQAAEKWPTRLPVECEICGHPSSVLIRCSHCEGSHCQACVSSPMHKCSSSAVRTSELVAEGYEPIGRDTLIPVARVCSCGETFEGSFESRSEADDALRIWSEIHIEQGHEVKESTA